MKGTIGFCIMSWRNPKTLAATLGTYKEQNLFSHFDKTLLLLQEPSSDDREVAQKFDLPHIETATNIGICGGIKLLAETIDTEYILLLEDDCPLIESEEEIIKQLELAKYRLKHNQVDVYRLRHRWKPGQKFTTIDKFKKYHLTNNETYNFYKPLLRLIRPNKYKKLIGTAVYVHENPKGYLYDKYITSEPEGDFIIDSAVLPWTNQSVLCKRKWLINTILKYVEENPSNRTVKGFQDIEKSLNCSWWRDQHFKIGVTTGLFSHERLE